MKLLHTSDWHFGKPAGLGTYEENQRCFLDQLYELIQREKVDAVLCAGDVYDSGLANAATIELYNDAVTQLCGRLKVPMVLIAGNHDSAPRLSACRELWLLHLSDACSDEGRFIRAVRGCVPGHVAVRACPKGG